MTEDSDVSWEVRTPKKIELMNPHVNILDEARKVINEYYDGPLSFIEAGSYFIASMTLGRYFEAPYLPRGSNRPNIYFLLSSDPAITHRSTLDRHIKDILRKNYIDMNFDNFKAERKKKKNGDEDEEDGGYQLIPVDEEDVEKDEKTRLLEEQFDKHFIESGSPEGIADRIQDTNFPYYAFMGSEQGEVFTKVTDTNDYRYGTISIFDKIYYGEEYSVALSTRTGKKNRRIRPNIYGCFFGSMQDAKIYIKDPFLILQGLMRRMILVYEPTRVLDRNRYLPYSGMFREFTKEKMEKVADIITARERELIHIQKEFYDRTSMKRIPVYLSPAVEKNLFELGKKQHDETIDNAVSTGSANLLSLYFVSKDEWLTKIAFLEAICDPSALNENGVVIDSRHYEKARTFLSKLEDGQKDVIGSITKNQAKEKRDLSFEQKQAQIIAYLTEFGPTRNRQLSRAHQWKDYEEVMQSILNQGRIERELVQDKGSKFVQYKLA